MTESARLFILAGESSGDRLGAALLEALSQTRKLSLSGVGGDEMAAQGLVSLFPLSDLAVMGYGDVIARLPLLVWRLRMVTRTILRERPDCVVLIDAQVFSQIVAQRLRKRGYRGTIILFVAPSVWAYRPERARAIAPLYDEVLGVLPFEPAAMRALGGPPTVYVGHPAVARYRVRPESPDCGPVLLLPGSRGGELRRHLPLMREVARGLTSRACVEGFVIPTPAALQAKVSAAVADWDVPVRVVSSPSERQAALDGALAAFAVSGTVTLELALAGVPHAITYVAEPAQVRMFKNGTTPWIGLPNILAGREIVPEILYAGRPDPQRALEAMDRLVTERTLRSDQRDAFARVRETMEQGHEGDAVADPARRVSAWLDAGSTS